MIRFSIILFYSFCLDLSAQGYHDFVWPFAYKTNNSPSGVSILNFKTLSGNPEIYHDETRIINYELTCAPVADSFGNFLFSYNGLLIDDASGKVMENGNSFGEWNLNGGIPDGGIILPIYKKNDQYILIHETWNYLGNWGTAGNKIYYSIIDMNKNSGLGAVISKNNLVFSDTLDYGKLSVTRHANGRDWWVVVPKYDSNIYFTFIVNPDSLFYYARQEVGEINRAGFGQATFSPNGKYYAKFSTINEVLGAYFDIYNFDRCTGQLSNHHQIFFSNGVLSGGVSFSPNSQILYISYLNHVYQVDLNKSVYELITVADYDGYLSQPNPSFLVPTYFGLMRLGPDGKIYCSPTISPVRELHTIDEPNFLGVDCKVNQHSIELSALQQSLPNFPNYRLGPIDGSSCDTLSIDNRPVAWWRCEQDTLDPLLVEFIDLSYYEPTYWHWDFGDNNTSSEGHPVHTFAKEGIYKICLTVGNANSSDSLCRTLYLGVSAEDNPVLQSQIQVNPNPFRNRLLVALNAELRSPEFRMYNQLGILVSREFLSYGITEIRLSDLQSGIYFWEISTIGEIVKKGKVVKTD